MHLPHGSASKEDNTLQLLIIKEVVESPEAARLTKRVTGQIWVIAVNSALRQKHFLIHRSPESWAQLPPTHTAHGRECSIYSPLNPS